MNKSKLALLPVVLIIFSSASLQADDNHEYLSKIHFPDGFVLVNKAQNTESYVNQKENTTLVIAKINSYREDFRENLKDGRFVNGLIAGQEEVGRLKIESYKIKEIEKISVIELKGRFDLRGDQEWMPNRKILFAKRENLFMVSLTGPKEVIEAKDNLFNEIVKNI